MKPWKPELIWRRNKQLKAGLIKPLLLGVVFVMQLPVYAQYPTTNYPDNLDRFEDEIMAIEDRIASIDHSRPLVLFIGSSSIRMWDTLEEDMGSIQVFNAGFGGATMPEVYHYLDRIILPVKPDYIIYYCGENDIADFGAKTEHVVYNYGKLIGALEYHFPETPIYFVSIKPSPSRWEYWDEMKNTNAMMQKFHSESYIDISEAMLTEEGEVRSDIFIEDDLHLNEKGYKIWTDIIRRFLGEKME